MSIVIDGIEQPKDCAHCRFALNQDYCIAAKKYIPHEVLISLQRAEFCTARPLVRGKWIAGGTVFPIYTCSQCHAVSLGGNFCPNCMADMREEKIDG